MSTAERPSVRATGDSSLHFVRPILLCTDKFYYVDYISMPPLTPLDITVEKGDAIRKCSEGGSVTDWLAHVRSD